MFVTFYLWKFQTKRRFAPEKIPQDCVTGLKTNTFLINLASPNSFLGTFLIEPWSFHILFFQNTPTKFNVINPPTCLEYFLELLSYNCHAKVFT